MGKQLKLWNGRGYCCKNTMDPAWKKVPSNCGGHVFIAAYSRADAARVIEQYTGRKGRGLDHELKIYFAECWGNAMDGVEPDRGLWISYDGRMKPVRVV